MEEASSPVCVACAAVLAPDAMFCSQCGACQPATCISCGAAMDAGARFCARCGVPVAPTSRMSWLRARSA